MIILSVLCCCGRKKRQRTEKGEKSVKERQMFCGSKRSSLESRRTFPQISGNRDGEALKKKTKKAISAGRKELREKIK